MVAMTPSRISSRETCCDECGAKIGRCWEEVVMRWFRGRDDDELGCHRARKKDDTGHSGYLDRYKPFTVHALVTS